jgi:transcriptional regulator with XRE-family HTH domain
MGPEPTERWNDLGAFIREQRSSARLSLRRLSELAGISNPYLSQIERGLRRPSAEILQQIAKALRISAETLYVQAGILDPPTDVPDLARQILADPHLSEEQKQALVRIYLAFRREHDGPVDGQARFGDQERGDQERTDGQERTGGREPVDAGHPPTAEDGHDRPAGPGARRTSTGPTGSASRSTGSTGDEDDDEPTRLART